MDAADSGSSPPVRGTVGNGRRMIKRFRFIPARAGNRGSGLSWLSPVSVHPRPCGEQIGAFVGKIRTGGSSPPVRGTGLAVLVQMLRNRFIPARAGNRVSSPGAPALTTVHPRPCGEQTGSMEV